MLLAIDQLYSATVWEIKFQKTNMRIKEFSIPLMLIKVNIFTWRISSLRCSICSEIHSGFGIITSLNPLFITGKKQRCSLETLFSQTTWSFFWDFAKSVRISSTMVGIHAPAYFSQFTPKIERRQKVLYIFDSFLNSQCTCNVSDRTY